MIEYLKKLNDDLKTILSVPFCFSCSTEPSQAAIAAVKNIVEVHKPHWQCMRSLAASMEEAN